ncbi:hypothetical protein [Tropicimonas sp. S265A]|uniref:hypothetical protein n=1 Tax=Tropicimonas sp. S265A TaxID=3415134 RepID=UPI003C7E8C76
MAAIAMAIGMGVLWVMGNPHAWTGAVGGLAAIALRGWYLSSDELSVEWRLTNTRLEGPGWRQMDLDQITTIRTLGGSVQVITSSGDKHLLKYMADAEAVRAQIDNAVKRVRT